MLNEPVISMMGNVKPHVLIPNSCFVGVFFPSLLRALRGIYHYWKPLICRVHSAEFLPSAFRGSVLVGELTIYTTHTKKMFRQIVSKYLKKKNVNSKKTPHHQLPVHVTWLQFKRRPAGSTEALPGRIRHGWCDPSPLAVRVWLFHDTLNKAREVLQWEHKSTTRHLLKNLVFCMKTRSNRSRRSVVSCDCSGSNLQNLILYMYSI